MGRRWKRRGGMAAADETVREALRSRGYVRARDFEARTNSHNWLHILDFNIEEWAPRIYTRTGHRPSVTSLAPARHGGAILGLESALYVAGLLDQEPLPVQLVVPRGTRPSRFKVPPIEYHWSDTPDPEAKEVWFHDIRVPVHSPERAVLDILRARTPEKWPALYRGDVDEDALSRLAAPLRACEVLRCWLERLEPKPAPPPKPEPLPARAVNDDGWW